MTKRAHHNVSLRSSRELSLETKKLLMSHCFAERQAEMSMSSIEFVVRLAFFPIHITCYCHTYTTNFGRNKKVTLSRVIGIITREFYNNKFWF